MFAHFYNAILVIAYLIILLAQAEDEIYSKVNSFKSDSNIQNGFTAQSVQQSDKGVFGFLLKDKTLTDLNISFTNNENAINILKAAGSFLKEFNNASVIAAVDNGKENELKYEGNPSTLKKTINPLMNNAETGEKVEKIIPTINISSKEATFSIFKNILNLHTNNEKAIEILNSATTSMPIKIKNSTKEIQIENEKVDKVHHEMEIGESTTKSSDTTIKTVNNQLTANEIILSELTNLSHNDSKELSLGQKIQFQRSNINSETEQTVNSLAGTEILRNTSQTCGSIFGKRISFANETTLMEFPWTVLLLYNTEIRYHCGGSLITDKYVLTAAHCVAQEFYELVGVRLGEHDISEPKNDCAPDLVGNNICTAKIDVDVVKIIVHHNYSHLSFKNDIALLRLDNSYVSRSYYPICIQMPEMIFDGTMATVAGWGATEKAIRSEILLKANVPVLDISKCRDIYRYNTFNDSTEICGSGSNEVDVCKGDSGGALFYSKSIKGKDRYYQLGIVSLGVRRCGDKRFLPAVFTKIQGFYKWIESNLEY